MSTSKAKILTQLILTTTIAGIVGCGGGGGGGGNPPPPTGGMAPINSTSVTPIGDVLAGVGQVSVYTTDAPGSTNLTTQTNNNYDGLTLYTFDADPIGQTTCVDAACLGPWPALLADDGAAAAAPYSIITRPDGNRQWALRGKPLYFWAGNGTLPGDMAQGDVNGEGVGNVWRVARPGAPVLKDRINDPGQSSDYLVSSGDVITYVPSTPGGADFVATSISNLVGSSSPSNGDRISLYTFDPDVPGQSSVCGRAPVNPANGRSCLEAWPPVVAEMGSQPNGPYTLVPLVVDSQGTTVQQWAYQGKPLYYFFNDMQEGDITGDAIDNWRLARPQPYQQVSSATLGSFLASAGASTTLLDSDQDGTFDVTPVQFDDYTLYTYVRDETNPGASTCNTGCLQNWPPVLAGPNANRVIDLISQGQTANMSGFSLVDLEGNINVSGNNNNLKQWALNGEPLYFFIQDINNGGRNTVLGENVDGGVQAGQGNDFWNVARPAPVRTATVTDASTGNQVTVLVSEGDDDSQNARANIAQTLDTANTNAGDVTQGIGYTLYTFVPDQPGQIPSCTDTGAAPTCLDLWPALYAAPTDQPYGDYTIVNRPASENVDGQPPRRQWAYKGKPLYYFVNDNAPTVRANEVIDGITGPAAGDANGNGAAGGTWLLATP